MSGQSSSSSSTRSSPVLSLRMRGLLIASSVTLFALLLLTTFLSPFSYMVATAFKNQEQLTDPTSPPWPVEAAQYVHEGGAVTYTYTFQDKEKEVTLNPGDSYDLYGVPGENGAVHEWALIA